jgi:hypothetical protein
MVAICSPDHRSPDELARPALRVIEGGRSARSRLDRRVYARRRLVALALVILLVVLAAAVLDRVGALGVGPSAGGRAPAAGAVPVDGKPVGAAVHVVQPGETLWEIARAIAPNDDPRAVVDGLIARNGAAPIEVGQRLVLPS